MAYWEAGAAYLPYSQGYFPAEASAVAALTWAFDSAYGGSFSGGGPGDISGGGAGDYGFGGDFGGDAGGGGGD